MPYTAYARTRWLNTWRNVSGAIATTYASLHTADPGDTGASEVTGGSPAYARKAITWNAPAAGTMDGDAVTFDLPATTITHAGLWDASTAGNFLGSKQLTSPETFSAQGTYQITDIDAGLDA